MIFWTFGSIGPDWRIHLPNNPSYLSIKMLLALKWTFYGLFINKKLTNCCSDSANLSQFSTSSWLNRFMSWPIFFSKFLKHKMVYWHGNYPYILMFGLNKIIRIFGVLVLDISFLSKTCFLWMFTTKLLYDNTKLNIRGALARPRAPPSLLAWKFTITKLCYWKKFKLRFSSCNPLFATPLFLPFP